MIGQAEKCLISSSFINVSDVLQELKSRQPRDDKWKQNLTVSRLSSENMENMDPMQLGTD